MFITDDGVLCDVTNADIENGTLIIPEGVTSIGLWGFQECTELKHLVIPEGVKSIDDFAFDHCVGLEHIELPDNKSH